MEGRFVGLDAADSNHEPQPQIAGGPGASRPREDIAAHRESDQRSLSSRHRLVALSELKLNSRLVTYLRRCEEGSVEADVRAEIVSPSRPYQPWSLDRRLSEADIQTIISEFLSGTPKHELARKYSVSLSALKKLLRRRGIRRDRRRDTPH